MKPPFRAHLKTRVSCLIGVASLVFFAPSVQAQTPAAPATAASAPDPARTVRPEFAAVVQAAQTLTAEGKHAEALNKLGDADALPNRTPWETWVLERNRASVAQRAGNNARLMQALGRRAGHRPGRCR